MNQKRWIYHNNLEGVEAMGINTRPVGGAKKYTSIPKHLFRMRMVLPSQKKIPISRDMGRVRKERYMLKWGKG